MLLNVFFTTIPTKETLIVKLHFKHANPTGLQLDGVGVDFVSPPSQQNISPATHGKYPQQPMEHIPHNLQPSPKSTRRK